MDEQERIQEQRKAQERAEVARRARFATIAYYCMGLVLLGLLLLVLGATIKTAMIDGWAWKALAESRRQPDVYTPANRGNIYADDGTALAISVPMYKTYIDFRAQGFKDSLFTSQVNSLADSLAAYFGDKSRTAYRNHLMAGYKKRKLMRLMDFEVNHTQLKAMRKMPFLSLRNRNVSGFITEMAIRREKPFGTMASRTIGFLKRDVDSLGVTHGSSGLELAFDSLLCGVPGVDMKIRTSLRYERKTKIPPIDGKDVHTTINAAIQDITEQSLRDMLVEVDADWGCAIVMETATGAIKAISNLDRQAVGVYAESTNHALADLLEPGSTFKVPSMCAALEEGVCTPTDTIDVGNGLYTYAKRVVRDHNAHKGGYGRITAAQSIWYSSNVGVVKIILKGFEKNPKKYLEKLDEMSFFQPIHLQIPGTAKAIIDRDVENWDRTKLPWVSFGYATMVPPIYICRFYNAIANNGKMMEPYIVTSVTQRGKVLEENEPKVVNKQIVSDKTLQQIRQMLRDVVHRGTGKDADSPHIQIAGKTGTAQRSAGKAGYVGQGHNVSFCGFFPYEKPKYTCMVTVSRPRIGYPSGGRIAGGVVRKVAEQIYATTMTVPLQQVEADSTATFVPTVIGGEREAIREAMDWTNTPKVPMEKGEWLYYSGLGKDTIGQLLPATHNPQTVPHFVGMTPRDALLLAQQYGLQVQIVGHGHAVVQQSVRSGTPLKSRQTVTLTIR